MSINPIWIAAVVEHTVNPSLAFLNISSRSNMEAARRRRSAKTSPCQAGGSGFAAAAIAAHRYSIVSTLSADDILSIAYLYCRHGFPSWIAVHIILWIENGVVSRSQPLKMRHPDRRPEEARRDLRQFQNCSYLAMGAFLLPPLFPSLPFPVFLPFCLCSPPRNLAFPI